MIVGLGGSATTDGGTGALLAVEEAGGIGPVSLIGACDVTTGFVEAAAGFGPQKGADPEQVSVLEDRLRQLVDRYRTERRIDLVGMQGAGAAGGMGGAVVLLGGRLQPGYRVVADLVGFGPALSGSDLMVTGEGAFDATSLDGKVAGSTLRDAAAASVPAVVIAGQVTSEARRAAGALGATVVSLTERFGRDRAMGDPEGCVEAVVGDVLVGVGG